MNFNKDETIKDLELENNKTLLSGKVCKYLRICNLGKLTEVGKHTR